MNDKFDLEAVREKVAEKTYSRKDVENLLEHEIFLLNRTLDQGEEVDALKGRLALLEAVREAASKETETNRRRSSLEPSHLSVPSAELREARGQHLDAKRELYRALAACEGREEGS